LARTGQTATLRGRDRVEGYLLLATACDGTLSTTAQFTSVRVVCNNTLAIALNGSSDAVKVSHRSDFDADGVKRQLGVAVSTWDTFVQKMYSLSNLSIGPDSVDAVLASVFDMPLPGDSEVAPKLPHKAISQIRALYQGDALGASLASSSGTAWGLLNSITEYVDHHRRARNNDYRIDAAWFGVGAQLKRRAWDATVALID
jgi:phage/plasmid-like protein (TIGR03299 family)